MSNPVFRDKVMGGTVMTGTFVKTPAHDVIEVLAQSDLDFLCLDAEHSPFDRARMDICLAVGKALGVPMLVRVACADATEILQALDSGADGVVVPHVDSVEIAEMVAKASRYGQGGRGYAGSTRSGAFATRSMPQNIDSAANVLVFAQIEDPASVAAADQIAAVDGIDGVFLGPTDLSVAYGETDASSPSLKVAQKTVGKAAARHDKAYMTFISGPEHAADLLPLGVTMFFVASEHTWMRAGANQVAQHIAALSD